MFRRFVLALFFMWIAVPEVAFTAKPLRWPDERQVGPLICHADFPLDDYLSFIQDITRLQQDVLDTLGVGETRQVIHIYLFAERGTYRRYLKKHFPNVPYRRALYIKGLGPGMVFAYASGDLEIDLRHECTHALLHASLPMVPLWLDEGLAEYFELPADQREFGSPYLAKTRRHLRFRRYAKMSVLETISAVEQMDGNGYRDSWAWVHFMLHGPPQALDELRSFLSDIYSHIPPDQLSNRLKQRIPDLDRQFARHFRR